MRKSSWGSSRSRFPGYEELLENHGCSFLPQTDLWMFPVAGQGKPWMISGMEAKDGEAKRVEMKDLKRREGERKKLDHLRGWSEGLVLLLPGMENGEERWKASGVDFSSGHPLPTPIVSLMIPASSLITRFLGSVF